jgi:hypothetical protein
MCNHTHTHTAQFDADAKLGEAFEAVQQHLDAALEPARPPLPPPHFTFKMTHPRTEFTYETSAEQTMRELGLIPSATLILSSTRSLGGGGGSDGGGGGGGWRGWLSSWWGGGGGDRGGERGVQGAWEAVEGQAEAEGGAGSAGGGDAGGRQGARGITTMSDVRR